MLRLTTRCAILALTIGDACCVGPTVDFEFRPKGAMVRSQLPGMIELEMDSGSQPETRRSLREEALPLTGGNLATGAGQVFVDMHEDHSWAAVGHRIFGLVLAFLNITLSSVGFILQRKAHLQEVEESTGVQGSLWPGGVRCPHPLWLVGVIVYTLSALPDLLAYTLIPQVLCSAVGCFRIVLVSALGYVVLGECLTRREVVGIIICTFGALLCIRYGPGNDTKLENFSEVYRRRLTCYVIAGLLAIGVLLVIVHKNSLRKMHSLALPLATALAFGLEKVFNSELAYVSMPRDVLHQPLWLGLVAGVAFFGLIDFYLNLRAAQYLPLYVYVPLSFAFGACVQNFQSLVILSELAEMNVYRAAFTLLGASLALVGALVIQPPYSEDRTKHQH